MASDTLQNKTYSHSCYVVANIWHLLIVPKLPFFPPTAVLTTPHGTHLVPPNLTECPFPLPQVHRHGRTAGFKHSLGICCGYGLLLAGKRYSKGYYCWIYYSRVGCVRFYAGFLLWPRCWPEFHFGSRINNCWAQPANIFWWSNFLPALECCLNYIWNAGIWDKFTTPQKVRYRILAFPLLFNNGKVILI